MKKITPGDPETRSANLVTGNIEELKRLFPEAVTEGRVDFGVLRQLLGDAVDDEPEKYGLSWHGKRRARALALTPSTGTLRPAPEESVDWETTQNVFIEGDNLEVLKLLQKSYAGKVKLIYIDPPYNTGRDFVYPDDFRDGIRNYQEITGQVEGGRRVSSNTEASGRFHTDWLNMMYPRVKLARDLLRPDGLICISIDDNERDDLKKLCDEILGEENFIESIIWKKRYGGGAKEKHLVTVHEYILVYAKDVGKLGELYVPQSDDAITRYYTKKDRNFETRGPYRTHPLEATKSMGDRPNLIFAIPGPDGSSVHPKRQWLWSPDRVREALKGDEIEFLRDREGNWSAHSKQYLKDADGVVRQAKAFSIIDDVFSQHGTNELLELFGDAHIFPFPKPTGLVRPLLEFGAAEPGSLVMDFFAGSGTTAHSIMQLNASDNGARRYLLVQLPEPIDPAEQKSAADLCSKLNRPLNIAELTKERLRRASETIREQSPLTVGDVGFRVLKLAESNIRAWEPQPEALQDALFGGIQNLREDRTELDLLAELLLKLSIELSAKIEVRTIVGKPVHAVAGGVLIACLSPTLRTDEIEPLANGIIAWHRELDPAAPDRTDIVVRDSAFADDVAKTNFAAILTQAGISSDRIRSL